MACCSFLHSISSAHRVLAFPTLASQHYALENYMPFFSGQKQELVQK